MNLVNTAQMRCILYQMQLQKSKVYWIKIKFSAICCLETLKDFQVCQIQIGEILFFSLTQMAQKAHSATPPNCAVLP